jgi:hypothetical protein
MSVKAPQDGIVIYRTNWRDEKKKVGDTMWFGETVLAIPDLSEMRADAFVDEADGGAVAEGQSVILRLEARDLDWGTSRVGRTVAEVWRAPEGPGQVAIESRPTVMRPAMRFAARSRRPHTGLLLVPGRLSSRVAPGRWCGQRRSLDRVPVRVGAQQPAAGRGGGGLGGDRLSRSTSRPAPGSAGRERRLMSPRLAFDLASGRLPWASLAALRGGPALAVARPSRTARFTWPFHPRGLARHLQGREATPSWPC